MNINIIKIANVMYSIRPIHIFKYLEIRTRASLNTKLVITFEFLIMVNSIIFFIFKPCLEVVINTYFKIQLFI